MDDNRLSLAEAAKLLGVARVTAWRWAKEGKLRAVKVAGRAYTTIADVERFKQEYIIDMADTGSKQMISPALS